MDLPMTIGNIGFCRPATDFVNPCKAYRVSRGYQLESRMVLDRRPRSREPKVRRASFVLSGEYFSFSRLIHPFKRMPLISAIELPPKPTFWGRDNRELRSRRLLRESLL
jgi:hypothetical protein